MAFANHFPYHVDDFQAAAGAGAEFNVGGLERRAQFLGGGEEVGGREEPVAAAAELGGDEGGVGDVGNDVVVGEGDVGFLGCVDEIGAEITLLEGAEIAFGVGAAVGAIIGAADWVFFFDDGEEGGVVACVDGVGEIVIGVFDEDGARNLVFLYHSGDGVDDISGLLLRIEKLELAASVGS